MTSAIRKFARRVKRALTGGENKRPAGNVPKVSLSKSRASRVAGIKGNFRPDPPRIDKPSVLFFTTHKCASVFVSAILRTAGRHTEFHHLDLAQAVFNLPEVRTNEAEDFMSERADELFFPTGEVYGPLRGPVDIPNADRFKMVFFLRDPRDVLVSAYYSFGFSHKAPKNPDRVEAFHRQREQIQAEGIDAFALRRAEEWILPHFSRYVEMHKANSNALYLSYDEYKDDTRGFLTRLFHFMDMAIPESALNEIAQKANPIQTDAKSDELNHQRSGRSGQFEHELKPDTVTRLNEMFSEILTYWGFEPSATMKADV